MKAVGRRALAFIKQVLEALDGDITSQDTDHTRAAESARSIAKELSSVAKRIDVYRSSMGRIGAAPQVDHHSKVQAIALRVLHLCHALEQEMESYVSSRTTAADMRAFMEDIRPVVVMCASHAT